MAVRNARLPGLGRVPKRLVDDAEFGLLAADTLFFVIEPGLLLAGGRILNEALAVPNELAEMAIR